MAPLGRKKKTAKPNPSNNKAEPEGPPSQIPLPTEHQLEESSPRKDNDDDKKISNKNSQSWYSKTLQRKAAPVTQIARESISSASNVISETASNPRSGSHSSSKSSSSPSLRLTRKPSRASPADATTTMVNAVSGKATSSSPEGESKSASKESTTEPTKSTLSDPLSDEDAQRPPGLLKTEEAGGSETSIDSKVDTTASSTRWLAWFSRSMPDTNNMADTKSASEPRPLADTVEREEQGQSTKDGSSSHADAIKYTDLKNINENGNQMYNDISKGAPNESQQVETKPPKRTWLQMFSNTSGAEQVAKESSSPQVPSSEQNTEDPVSVEPLPEAQPPEASPPPDLPGDGKSSGWAFWSRDRKSDLGSTASDSHVGELAISNTPSQKRPKRASISIEKPAETSLEANKPRKPTPKERSKRDESQQATPVSKEKQPKDPKDPKDPKKESSISTTAKAQDVEIASKALQNAIPNQLLPSFQDTFLLQENPTLMQQLGRLIGLTKSPEPRHLHLVRDPPRIKNALAIGVHGYFPAPLIRTMLGQPTGTSIKFADMATKAIRKWTASKGYDCEVKSAALEGEGRIGERVALLWKLLLNWIDEIRKSDFILVACHSQGVPVALMLVAKLISFGCVNSAKIGICAMAGVNLGPFPDYKSRWISGSAGELFEFSKSSSMVSKDLLASLETCLEFGVRVTYAGSIDDQLVSLESSIFSPITHPNIYRAVFIDGRVHAPNFLANLVGFVLKLRNLGVHDHGLIRELSSPLAGSLYTGEGHSRIYEEDGVYDLAVCFALETTSLPSQPIVQRPMTPSATANPYILPFAMRGLLEEEYVRTDLYRETQELLKQFDDWKPSSKVLKDVKFRLEGIRSKL